MISDYHKSNKKYKDLLEGKVIVTINKPKQSKLGNIPFRSNPPKGHKQSKGEEYIELILKGLKLKFHKEVEFKGCKNPDTGYKLRFDFFVESIPLCIEFDGEQHFRQVVEFDGDDNGVAFRKRVRLDKIKDAFCRRNKITLLRIPFNKIKLARKMIKRML